MVRSLPLLVAGLVAMCALAACSRPQADSVDPKGTDENVLRFEVWGALDSLDPRESERGSGTMVDPLLYSYLFVPDEEGRLEPDLAVEWSYDPAVFTWTIRLREGCLFHDGRPVTPLDVKYSLDSFFDKTATSARVQVDRIALVGGRSLAIALKQDNPYFLEDIWSTEILPSRAVGEGGHSGPPVGSGPFKFKYRKERKEVGLVANEEYYRGRPALDGVVITFQPDKEKSWARLLSGRTDLVWGIQPQDYTIMEHCRDRFLFSTTPDPFLTVLLYNTHHPLFTDRRVRTALAHAVDTTYIRDAILHGMGVLPTGMMGYYSSFRNPELRPTPFDPKKAGRLLEEAGWVFNPESRSLFKDGKPFEFTLLLFEENQLHQTIGQYLQLCLNDLGIKVHLQPLAFGALAQRFIQNDAFEAVVTEFNSIRTIGRVLQYWCPLEGRKTAVGCLEDSRLTDLILQAVREKEPQNRKRLLWEVDSLLTSLQPAIPLCQRASLNVLSRRFQFPRSFSAGYPRFHLWQIAPSVKRP